MQYSNFDFEVSNNGMISIFTPGIDYSTNEEVYVPVVNFYNGKPDRPVFFSAHELSRFQKGEYTEIERQSSSIEYNEDTRQITYSVASQKGIVELKQNTPENNMLIMRVLDSFPKGAIAGNNENFGFLVGRDSVLMRARAYFWSTRIKKLREKLKEFTPSAVKFFEALRKELNLRLDYSKNRSNSVSEDKLASLYNEMKLHVSERKDIGVKLKESFEEIKVLGKVLSMAYREASSTDNSCKEDLQKLVTDMCNISKLMNFTYHCLDNMKRPKYNLAINKSLSRLVRACDRLQINLKHYDKRNGNPFSERNVTDLAKTIDNIMATESRHRVEVISEQKSIELQSGLEPDVFYSRVFRRLAVRTDKEKARKNFERKIVYKMLENNYSITQITFALKKMSPFLVRELDRVGIFVHECKNRFEQKRNRKEQKQELTRIEPEKQVRQ